MLRKTFISVIVAIIVSVFVLSFGVTAADEKVTDIKALYTAEQLCGDGIVVRRGKKTYKKIVLK